MKTIASASIRRRPAAHRPDTVAPAAPSTDPAVPRGASLKDVIREIEISHPDLAALSPLSSTAVEVGDMVREMRLAADMPQKRLAEAAGLSQPALSAIERGEGKDGPTYRTLRDLAEALGMRVAFVPAAAAAEAPERRPKLARR